MSTKVPISKDNKENGGEGAGVIFVGPSKSGKTTGIVLLHQTLIDYRDDLKCTYTPSIKNDALDLFVETNNLILNGISVTPTPPSKKDARIEFNIEFDGGIIHKKKKVKLLFADMSGEISKTLMKVFPTLINSSPQKVREQLEEANINQEDVDYLVHTLLSSRGVILVADASKLGTPESPDPELAKYLNNLYQYAEMHGEAPKGFALLLTKFDQFSVPGYGNPKAEKLRELAKNYLCQTENYASNFTKNNKTLFKIFYSVLKPQDDAEGGRLFVVNTNNARHQNRVEYSVQQYRQLIEWLRDTFGE
jgi:hypothetical protein